MGNIAESLDRVDNIENDPVLFFSLNYPHQDLQLVVPRSTMGAIMASENVKEFTDANFEAEVLKSGEPVLVDFWAEWCMPCRMLAPTIEKLAKEYSGKVKVGKVDTDSNRDISVKYGISAIPTVILFKNGQVAHKFVGLRKENEFKEALDASA
jgi:thioredoxin 1